jgi:hypothetical protein
MDEGWCHWVFLDWICRGFVDRLEIVDRPGTSFPSMARATGRGTTSQTSRLRATVGPRSTQASRNSTSALETALVIGGVRGVMRGILMDQAPDSMRTPSRAPVSKAFEIYRRWATKTRIAKPNEMVRPLFDFPISISNRGDPAEEETARKTLLENATSIPLETATSTVVHMGFCPVEKHGGRKKEPAAPPAPRHSPSRPAALTTRAPSGRLTASICQGRTSFDAGKGCRATPLHPTRGRRTGMACRCVSVSRMAWTPRLKLPWSLFVLLQRADPSSLQLQGDDGGGVGWLAIPPWCLIISNGQGIGAFALPSCSMSRKGYCSPLTPC